MFYRDYRYKHANYQEKMEMIKQMISDNRRYYPKGKDVADSTFLEYEQEKLKKRYI